ncbi:MAG: hypothetical protein FWD75_00260 [Propionibacteriaceae bacterium]|nr:hypothetical protein [Propionibacteriaceae bacterium]
MTVTFLLGSWALAACALLFLLVAIGTAHRVRQRHPLLRYKRLGGIDQVVRWTRIGWLLVGLVAGVAVTLATPHYQAILVAPSLWAAIGIIGVVAVDWFLLGRHENLQPQRPTIHVARSLPWGSLVLTVVLTVVIQFAARWAEAQSSLDQRSHVYSWVLDGVFGWGSASPFPGTFYTANLGLVLPFVFFLAAVGIAGVFLRPAYVPDPKYARLDQGFRQRTIRDIGLFCLVAVAPTLALMSIDVAWVFATLGPGSPGRTLVVVVSVAVGAGALVVSCWVLANLLFLPVVVEHEPDFVPNTARVDLKLPAVWPVGVKPTKALLTLIAALAPSTSRPDETRADTPLAEESGVGVAEAPSPSIGKELMVYVASVLDVVLWTPSRLTFGSRASTDGRGGEPGVEPGAESGVESGVEPGDMAGVRVDAGDSVETSEPVEAVESVESVESVERGEPVECSEPMEIVEVLEAVEAHGEAGTVSGGLEGDAVSITTGVDDLEGDTAPTTMDADLDAELNADMDAALNADMDADLEADLEACGPDEDELELVAVGEPSRGSTMDEAMESVDAAPGLAGGGRTKSRSGQKTAGMAKVRVKRRR